MIQKIKCDKCGTNKNLLREKVKDMFKKIPICLHCYLGIKNNKNTM